eukprot:m.267326 g.267326  ORF g.267326 m.267326 type:complete len:109 (-) comp11070_c1_seq5:1282-1608(-)
MHPHGMLFFLACAADPPCSHHIAFGCLLAASLDLSIPPPFLPVFDAPAANDDLAPYFERAYSCPLQAVSCFLQPRESASCAPIAIGSDEFCQYRIDAFLHVWTRPSTP